MKTPLRFLAASLAALAAMGARADVFSDAYQCVKANAKLALVTAEVGPAAVEFVVTKPQCVALVTSPAPVPTGVMVGTLGLTATNVLPRKNPQCEGALYTTAAKPVAKILDKVGLLPESINKQISSGAADAAVGQAVQNIPGASIAFASFSCGCGLSNAGLNPDTVKEIYKAVGAAGSKCSDVLGNVIEGGAKGIESAASAAGDVLSGQTKHVDPQVYYKAAFRPRLYRDYAAFRNQPQNLRPYIWNDEPVPQCIHYFDKHTMSPDNASKTCYALADQYFAEYAKKQPEMEEVRQMTDLRTFGPDTQSAGRFLLNSDTSLYGKYCATKFKTEPGYTVDKRARESFQLACMTTAGLYLGYTVKHYEFKFPNWTYTVNQNSADRFQSRMAAAANNSAGRKAADIRKQTIDQLYAEFAPFADKAYPVWVSTAVKQEKEADAKGVKQAESNKEKEAKDKADKEAKDKAAGAKSLAEAQAACKDERCKADIVSYLANCKSRSGGTEGAQFKSDLNCKSNIGVLHDISARRAALDARLDGEVKKHVSVLCPPDKDCSTGVHKQRSDIQAEEDKVWKYVSDSANERGNQDNAKALIYAEALKMLTPIEAKTIVAATVTKVNTVGREPVRIPGKKANDPPPPPPVAVNTPQPVPTTPVKPATTYNIPPPVAKPPPPPTFPKNTPGSIGGNLAAGGSSIVAGCEPKSASELQALVCETEAALNKCRSLIVSGKVRSCAKAR